MYEKFTDASRKVMKDALQAAQKFAHEYVGSEHILYGVLKTEGRATAILTTAGYTTSALEAMEVFLNANRGPAMATLGKLPMTPTAKKVIERAMELSLQFKQAHVGTEHLLLAMVEVDCVAQKTLAAHGDLDRLRCAVTFNEGDSEDFKEAKAAEWATKIPDEDGMYWYTYDRSVEPVLTVIQVSCSADGEFIDIRYALTWGLMARYKSEAADRIVAGWWSPLETPDPPGK